MNTKTMHIGILSRDAFIKRTFDIVQGKHKRRKDEPKIWFESMKSMLQVVNDENRELLRLIIEHKPQSLAELEKLTARKTSALSRTLKTLERIGIVELPKKGGKMAPVVKAMDFRLEFRLGST